MSTEAGGSTGVKCSDTTGDVAHIEAGSFARDIPARLWLLCSAVTALTLNSAVLTEAAALPPC